MPLSTPVSPAQVAGAIPAPDRFVSGAGPFALTRAPLRLIGVWFGNLYQPLGSTTISGAVFTPGNIAGFDSTMYDYLTVIYV